MFFFVYMLTQNFPIFEIVLDAKVRDMEGLEKKKKKRKNLWADSRASPAGTLTSSFFSPPFA